MSFDWEGKTVLVTGASSGIGAALAERVAGRGATVAICARRADELETVLARCRAASPGSRMRVCDLADPVEVDELARWSLDELGGVDVLVNNAGIPMRRHVTRLDAATVDRVVRVNLLAPVQLTLALLEHMVARGSGHIVNVSSVAAPLASPGEAAYDASKAGLAAFSEAVAVDLWDTGVGVLVVYPGVVDTPLFDVPGNDPLPGELERIPVEELVDEVLSALDQGRREVYVPGWFKDLAAGKAADTESFLAGAADWVRQRADP